MTSRINLINARKSHAIEELIFFTKREYNGKLYLIEVRIPETTKMIKEYGVDNIFKVDKCIPSMVYEIMKRTSASVKKDIEPINLTPTNISRFKLNKELIFDIEGLYCMDQAKPNTGGLRVFDDVNNCLNFEEEFISGLY